MNWFLLVIFVNFLLVIVLGTVVYAYLNREEM